MKATSVVTLLLLILAVIIAAVACGEEEVTEVTTTTAATVQKTTTTEAVQTIPSDPTKTIIDNLTASGSFNTLVQLLEDVRMTTLLMDPGAYTVFAPVDAGLAEIPSEELAALKADTSVNGPLASLLAYHLVPRRITAAEMNRGLEVTTATGKTAVITIEDGVPHFNGVEIVQSDILCSNGVIHAIASVSEPSEEEISIDESTATHVFNYDEGADWEGIRDLMGDIIDNDEPADWETLRAHMGERVVVIGTVVAVQGEAAGQVPALDGSDQIQIYLGSEDMYDAPLNPQQRFVIAIPPDSLIEFPYLYNLQTNTEIGIQITTGGTAKVVGVLYTNAYGGAGIVCTQKGQLSFLERTGWVQ